MRLEESRYYEYLSLISGTKFSEVVALLHKLEKRSYAGKMGIKEFTESVSARLGIKKSEVRWLQFVRENAVVDKEVVNLALEMRKKYRIGIITNADRSRYMYVTRHLGKQMHISEFDRIFASCYLGMMKPSKQIFQYVVKQMKVMPDEAIFIDDHIENVEGAEAIGIKGILFNNLHDNVNYLKRQIEKFA